MVWSDVVNRLPDRPCFTSFDAVLSDFIASMSLAAHLCLSLPAALSSHHHHHPRLSKLIFHFRCIASHFITALPGYEKKREKKVVCNLFTPL